MRKRRARPSSWPPRARSQADLTLTGIRLKTVAFIDFKSINWPRREGAPHHPRSKVISRKAPHVTISYDAEKKATTLRVQGGCATVPGVASMQATWRIRFGQIDPSMLGDELISKLR